VTEVDRSGFCDAHYCRFGRAVSAQSSDARNPATDEVEMIDPPPTFGIGSIEY